MSLPLESQIEALLFWKAETLSIKKIANILNKDVEEIKTAIQTLRESLKGRGVTLIEWEEDITLGTAKEVSELIETLNKEELSKDLGKAGLETLSIILYQGPISRVDIDYIRGVNSQFIIRNLLIRGLIEKVDNPMDQRSFLYKPSLELLAFLGISKVADLPDFESVRKDIESFKKAEASSSNDKEQIKSNE
jgi:segregation and condensation protein B